MSRRPAYLASEPSLWTGCYVDGWQGEIVPEAFVGPGIYKITNIITGKFYVGSAKNIGERIRRHFWDLRSGNHANKKFQNSYNKHGEHSFLAETILKCEVADLLDCEQRYLDELGAVENGYNICRKAGSPLGVKHSKETKRRMSLAARGRKMPPWSLEHRRNSGLVQRGKKRSLETRKKMSQSHKGKRHSDEHRKNIGLAQMGKTYSTERIANAVAGRFRKNNGSYN